MSRRPTVIRHRENSLARVPDASILEASWLREVARAAGADDVGFVSVDRPEIAAEHEDIRALLPEARTLLSFVCRMNRENVRKVKPRSRSVLRPIRGESLIGRIAPVTPHMILCFIAERVLGLPKSY